MNWTTMAESAHSTSAEPVHTAYDGRKEPSACAAAARPITSASIRWSSRKASRLAETPISSSSSVSWIAYTHPMCRSRKRRTTIKCGSAAAGAGRMTDSPEEPALASSSSSPSSSARASLNARVRRPFVSWSAQVAAAIPQAEGPASLAGRRAP